MGGRFKEFNDAYGFLCGDELIRVAAHMLEVGASRLGEDARLGHIGGDDFVIACRGPVNVEPLQRVCDDFDRHKMSMFNGADIDRGAFRAVDRQGRAVVVPLTTLSLAAIGGTQVGPGLHPALLSQIAASLKKEAKRQTTLSGRSLVLFERRQHASSPNAALSAE